MVRNQACFAPGDLPAREAYPGLPEDTREPPELGRSGPQRVYYGVFLTILSLCFILQRFCLLACPFFGRVGLSFRARLAPFLVQASADFSDVAREFVGAHRSAVVSSGVLTGL